ncbi:MAG TPA: right-handed parallel beta-helix repeat-containing protein [Tepidisphaeraceae bacterium]|nr:right-handed parallel beta-helix repeat-containing protein [Tepidisphaeraceae bacterium]
MPHVKIHPVFIALFVSQAVLAAEFYVAPNGTDSNPGTIERPFGSVARGQEAASPGDTVWIRGGVYEFTGTEIAIGTLLNKSGKEGSPINYFAYKDELPVFDFFKLATVARIKGFSVTGNWIHLRGLEVRGVQQIITTAHESWGIRVEGGSNCIFEHLNLHHNEGPGLFIAAGGNNLVLNCDSHDNYDPDARGENADGFGGHSNMDGNVFRYCRSWNNSDDGYDLINAPGVHTIEYCWSWHNGFIRETNQKAGNGGGFKCGGFLLNPARFPGNVPRHVIRFNLSFNNAAEGFYANYHPGQLQFYNNTAFNNPTQFNMQSIVKPVTHVLRNNIAFSTTGVPPLTHVDPANPRENDPDDQFNSWNEGYHVSTDDFLSIDPKGVDAPRAGDGSLPKIEFMHLKPGSKLIDAGKDVRLPFKGAAPDLGAFETE